MTCNTCGGLRIIAYAESTCQAAHVGICPSCVGTTIATAPVQLVATQPTTSQTPTLPDGFVHPDVFARDYKAAVNGKMPVSGHADGCGAHDNYRCDCAAIDQSLLTAAGLSSLLSSVAMAGAKIALATRLTTSQELKRAYRLGFLRAKNPEGWDEQDDITHGDAAFDDQMQSDLDSEYPS